jgi:DNA-binding NtrC family response regulator
MMRMFVFGSSPAMLDLQRKIGQIARAPIPVLVEGEAGTGKEALARYIHAVARAKVPFARHACSAGSPLRPLDEAARIEGWIFFKHVDRLDSAAQEHLLTMIDQEWGGCGYQRLISSSSQPLSVLVAQNRFNSALYHHLTGVRIAVPPLRERLTDIPEMFEAFVEDYATTAGSAAPQPSAELRDALGAYNWPGNGRELSNFAATFAFCGNNSEMVKELRRRSDTAQSPVPSRMPLKEQVRRASREVESGIILRTLQNHRWNRRRAAETLNISYRSLLYKMKACDLRGENTGGGDCK